MKNFILSLFILSSFTVLAQEDGKILSTEEEKKQAEIHAAKNTTATDTVWRKGGLLAFNLNQVALHNWAAGGESSVAFSGKVLLFANYKKGKIIWDNALNLGLGYLSDNSNFVKTDDVMEYNTSFGLEIKDKSPWYYSAYLSFRSQFAPAYDDDNGFKISDFMSPGYVIGGLGMEYKPNDNFKMTVAPLSTKTTIVLDQLLADAGAFGLDGADEVNGFLVPGTGSNSRVELGAFVKFSYKKKLMENVTLLTRLDLFSNYLENPQNIDIYWDLLLGMKINEWLSASISTTLIYDDDVHVGIDSNDDGTIDSYAPRTQFKEVFALGLTYKFSKVVVK